jgi:hypothetical protein
LKTSEFDLGGKKNWVLKYAPDAHTGIWYNIFLSYYKLKSILSANHRNA